MKKARRTRGPWPPPPPRPHPHDPPAARDERMPERRRLPPAWRFDPPLAHRVPGQVDLSLLRGFDLEHVEEMRRAGHQRPLDLPRPAAAPRELPGGVGRLAPGILAARVDAVEPRRVMREGGAAP